MIWYFLAGMIAGAVGMFNILAALGRKMENNNDERTTGNQNDLD